MPSLPSPDAPFCKCDDPNCPAGPLMRKMNEMPTDSEAWEIENVSGFTMATTAAVKNRSDLVKTICCMTVNDTIGVTAHSARCEDVCVLISLR